MTQDIQNTVLSDVANSQPTRWADATVSAKGGMTVFKIL